MQTRFKTKEYYCALRWDYTISFSSENKTYTLALKNNDLSFSADTPEELLIMFPGELDKWIGQKLNAAKKNKKVEINEPINIDECNGRLSLKVSSSVHYNLLKEAQMEGITINHLINDILNCRYGKFDKAKYIKFPYDPNSTLAVVNCSKSSEEIKALKLYSCSTSGIAYSFKRFKYFGLYNEKAVDTIFEVKAVVDVPSLDASKCQIYWKNGNTPDEVLIAEILTRLNDTDKKKQEFIDFRKKQIEDFENRIFLLDEKNIAETNFIKDSHGGLYGVKKYFNNIAIGKKNIKELGEFLNGKKWSVFDRHNSVEKQE